MWHFLKPHEHDGVKHQPGDPAELPEPLLAALRWAGVVGPRPRPEAEPVPTPSQRNDQIGPPPTLPRRGREFHPP